MCFYDAYGVNVRKKEFHHFTEAATEDALEKRCS